MNNKKDLHENAFLPRLTLNEASKHINVPGRTLLEHCHKKFVDSFISCGIRYILLTELKEYKKRRDLNIHLIVPKEEGEE